MWGIDRWHDVSAKYAVLNSAQKALDLSGSRFGVREVKRGLSS